MHGGARADCRSGRRRRGRRGREVAATYVAAALVAMVLSSAVPIEPPSCWPTLSVAEATPASFAATPKVPVLKPGATDMPRPAPVSSKGPSTAATYEEWTPIPVSQTIPPAAISRPSPIKGFGPVRGISTTVEIWAKSISIAMAGMNAKPVTTGE